MDGCGGDFLWYRVYDVQKYEPSGKKAIATSFKLPVAILESWLHTMHHVRNICAHHARLWNRRLGIKPKHPSGKDFTDWAAFDNEKPFFVLLMLNYMLKFCAPTTNWHARVEALIKEFEYLPLEKIGFIKNWQKHCLWKNTSKKSLLFRVLNRLKN